MNVSTSFLLLVGLQALHSIEETTFALYRLLPHFQPFGAPNHSPFFYVDEGALPIGVRALSTVTMDYLAGE